MKKILILFTLIALVASCCTVSAQTPTTNPSDPVSYMTPTQKLQYEADLKLAEVEAIKNMEIEKLEKKVEQFGDWVGVGGEVGSAIEEGLSAVVDVADKFGKTDVGKFTLVLVAWKVMGKDVIKILLGIIFFGILVWVLNKFYRTAIIDRRVLIKKTPQGFWKRNIKEYDIIDTEMEGEEQAWSIVALIAAFLLGIWITYGIMF